MRNPASGLNRRLGRLPFPFSSPICFESRAPFLPLQLFFQRQSSRRSETRRWPTILSPYFSEYNALLDWDTVYSLQFQHFGHQTNNDLCVILRFWSSERNGEACRIKVDIETTILRQLIAKQIYTSSWRKPAEDLSIGRLVTDLKVNVKAARSRSISGCALDLAGKPFDTVELRFRRQGPSAPMPYK